MSANRSVQAAQRRRAGGPEPAAPGRGPQPSINSSQMFSGQGQQQQQQQQQQQMRPGTTGRLAGQQAQQMQQQQQQQMKQQMQGGNNEGLAGISKMTLAQAITLITLRLGKVETQMHHIHHDSLSNSNSSMSFASGEGAEGMENMVLVDKSLMDSIMSRLESLEKRSPVAATGGSGSGSGSGADFALLKQQFDAIKPSIAQNTKTATALTKEQKDHKQQMDALKNELLETKALLNALQTLSMDNSQKIFQMMSGEVVNGDENNEFTDVNDEDADASDDVDGDGESEELDITGANLKGLIEQELNA